MAYSHTTLSSAESELALRLGDTGNVFWSAAELESCINEALRTWNALTWFNRSRTPAYTVVANQSLYKIPTIFPSIVSYTLTDQSLMSDLQYALMEPATPTAWSGTEMFTLAGITSSMQRIRDRLLAESGVVLTERTVTPSQPPPLEKIDLPDTVIDVRRAVWNRSIDFQRFILFRDDEHSLSAGAASWSYDAHVPVAYTLLGESPLRMLFAPTANAVGTFELLTVETGASLDTTGSGVALGIPDDLGWVVKWGVLAELLGREGRAYDPLRSQYAEKRYRQGIELARRWTRVLHAEVDGRPVLPAPLHDLDGTGDWQNTTGTPTDIAVSGDFIALSKVPSAASHSLILDLFADADVPAGSGGNLQVGREHLSAVLDYAQHLASFKMGGEEFSVTIPIADRFFEQALNYNERLRAQAPQILMLEEQTTGEEKRRPYRKEA